MAGTATAKFPGGLNLSTGSSLHSEPTFKIGLVTLPTTTGIGDTYTVDLYENFGITNLLGMYNFTHTTENSVIVEDVAGNFGSSSVDLNVLSMTMGGTANYYKRTSVIYGF